MPKGVYKRKPFTKDHKKHIREGIKKHLPKTAFKKGHIPAKPFKKGQHLSPATEFKKGQNMGSDHPRWKGGKVKHSGGYIYLYKPEHPFCDKNKYILEHRFIVEQQIKRYLLPKEIVHHINEIKDDNRIENLMVFKNGIYHYWFHKKGYCNPKGIIFDGRNLETKT